MKSSLAVGVFLISYLVMVSAHQEDYIGHVPTAFFLGPNLELIGPKLKVLKRIEEQKANQEAKSIPLSTDVGSRRRGPQTKNDDDEESDLFFRMF